MRALFHCEKSVTAKMRKEDGRGTEASKQAPEKEGNSPKVVAVDKSWEPAETPECPAKKE